MKTENGNENIDTDLNLKFTWPNWRPISYDNVDHSLKIFWKFKGYTGSSRSVTSYKNRL